MKDDSHVGLVRLAIVDPIKHSIDDTANEVDGLISGD